MNRSGIKRTLAATAIAALAVAGLPQFATTASANSYAEQFASTPNGVVLYSLTSGQASTANDGANTTVHLLAGAGANVTSVRFEYTLNGTTWIPIATTTRNNGVFSTEWAPNAIVLGTPLTVRAVGVSAALADIGSDTAPATVLGTTAAVDITNAAGSTVKVFRQPYANDAGTAGNNNAGPHNYPLGVINGTTSDAAATPALTAYNLTTGAPTGSTAVNGTVFGAAGTPRSFKTTVDFTGYAFGSTSTPPASPAVNQAVVGITGGSDDAEAVTLVEQSITTVGAFDKSTPANVPPGGKFTGTITVTDGTDPVRGAQVVIDRDGDGNVGAGENGEHYYTNVNGIATIPDLVAPATGTGTYTAWVNTTDNDAYEPAVDFQRELTVTPYTPALDSLALTSKDGNAFDVDEYAAGDVRVQSLDQFGNPIAGQPVIYELSLAPFTTTPATPVPTPATGTVTTGADGFANIPFTNLGSGSYTLKAYVNLDGSPGPGAGDEVAPDLAFKAGDSSLVIGGANPRTAAQGGSVQFDATLALADGTVLPGRLVQFTYAPGAGGNAVMAVQGSQPPGTTRVSDTQATDVTDASGVVSATITDPATPVSGESGTMDADTIANAIGNAAEDAADVTVNFTGAAVAIAVDNATHKPGVVTTGTVTVTPANPATPVIGTVVTLTTDKGYFTDGTADPAAAIGANSGEFKSIGKTTTVTVDASGNASFKLAVEREAGFNDDGADLVIVKADLGTSSDTEDYAYSTAAPLNGDVTVTKLAQQDNPTDPTKVGDYVLYDVKAVDQFGNPVGGISLNTAVTGGTLDPAAGNGALTSDFDAAADLELNATAAGTANLTVTWANAPFSRYAVDNTNTPADADSDLDVVTGSTNNNKTATASQTFYAPSFATNVNTISSDAPAAGVPTGTVVTETVKVVDSAGRPVPNLDVQFFRSGPGNDSDTTTTISTNADGVALYRFTSNNAGTANITAIVSDGTSSRTLTNQVTFTAPAPPVAETFTMVQSPDGDQPVGTAVTETVTVLDQNGDGFAGATVNFTRSGPNGQTDSQSATTNSAGQATYTFVGSAAGTATVTAVIDYGTGTRTLTDTVNFIGEPEPETPVATEFELTSNPEGNVPTGTTVVETVTVLDQNEEGFAGATVTFTRADTGASSTATTNAAGQATFAVSRATGGTVNITAVVDYGTGTRTLNDAITFVAPTPPTPDPPVTIRVSMTTAQSGNFDVLNVRTDARAKGARVTLYKKVNGRNVVVQQKALGNAGLVSFRARDLNGAKKTTYFAVVAATKATKAGTSGVKTIK